MKKLLFVFPIAVLLSAGCNSSQQVSNQTTPRAPTAQNTSPASTPTSTTSQAADLKTYTNSMYGFQFQYPSGWNLLTCDPAKYGGAVVFFNSTNPTSYGCYGNNDSFGSIFVSTVQDLGNPGYGTPYNECVQYNLDDQHAETDLSVGGVSAKEFVSGSTANPTSITGVGVVTKEVCFVHGSGRAYYDLQINLAEEQSNGASSSVMDSQSAGFDTIVSTFKFITASASPK